MKPEISEKGILYLCATPIGNLEDISLRALRLLKEVDLVAAEDTRRTRKLFSHYDIHTSLTSYHQHNSQSKGKYLLDQLKEGKKVALVTDAGMPGISDPGEQLTVLAVSEGIKVVPVPGPSASLAALTASGLPSGRFCFEGFLPARGPVRRQRLEELKTEKRTLILYEAPHRLGATLQDLLAALGNRSVCIARELTKQYEEIWRGELAEAQVKYCEQTPRGEITLVVGGMPPDASVFDLAAGREEIWAMVSGLEQQGMPLKEAIKEAARKSGMPKREVYSLVLEERKKQEGNYPS